MQRTEVIEARTGKDLSLEQVAELIGMSASAISRFENGGKMRRVPVNKLCEALDIPFRDEYVAPRRLKKVRG